MNFPLASLMCEKTRFQSLYLNRTIWLLRKAPQSDRQKTFSNSKWTGENWIKPAVTAKYETWMNTPPFSLIKHDGTRENLDSEALDVCVHLGFLGSLFQICGASQSFGNFSQVPVKAPWAKDKDNKHGHVFWVMLRHESCNFWWYLVHSGWFCNLSGC